MPESRLQRTKATLPAGYQFGDAASELSSVLNPFMRELGKAAAARMDSLLPRILSMPSRLFDPAYGTLTANVIEGDQH